ncbi:MAG: SDR family oxidoreductase [Spirochaetales bacterium]|nr:SDR family oxidoreductase [Spirochaetales bacterium]
MSNADFVLITGAARRIGRSMALAVATAGDNVALHYHTSEKEAISLKATIEALGRKVILVKGDLSKEEEVEAIIPTILEQGKLKALINNASIFEPFSLYSANASNWGHNLMVNLTAPYLLSRAFALGAKEGIIINILDWRALRADAEHLPYAVSKGALHSLTLNLAEALAPAIRVNGIALGAILPPEGRGISTDPLMRVPLKRWGTLEEVNQSLLFLLNGPSYITGEVLHLDGGRHLV